MFSFCLKSILDESSRLVPPNTLVKRFLTRTSGLSLLWMRLILFWIIHKGAWPAGRCRKLCCLALGVIDKQAQLTDLLDAKYEH